MTMEKGTEIEGNEGKRRNLAKRKTVAIWNFLPHVEGYQAPLSRFLCLDSLAQGFSLSESRDQPWRC